jgi:hypothetical protein
MTMGTWAQMSDFSMTLPDRPGELARLAARLRAADVNLLGLWGYGGEGREARFFCVPESSDQFRNFAESAGLAVREGHCFYIAGDDSVGALVRTLEDLASAAINLRGIQTVAARGHFGCFVWADPKDWEKLAQLLDRQ